jgi:hypothetical protein
MTAFENEENKIIKNAIDRRRLKGRINQINKASETRTHRAYQLDKEESAESLKSVVGSQQARQSID